MRLITLKQLSQVLRPGQRLLGMDVGDRNIGLAISDVNNRLASPHSVLYRKQSAIADNVQKLEALVDQHSIVGFVIGYPLQLSGQNGVQGVKTKAFIKELQHSRRFENLNYIMWDERLTSATVQNAIGSLDISGRRRKSIMDKFSALSILQGCLDGLSRV